MEKSEADKSADPFSGFTPAERQELARLTGVNRPIMSIRVVGNRVELHQLGGTVTSLHKSPQEAPIAPEAQHATYDYSKGTHSSSDNLRKKTVRQLHDIAFSLGLKGYHKLKKADLIDLILADIDDA